MARVQVLREVQSDPTSTAEWDLWFQWCRYLYDDGGLEYGYRFIWRRPDGSLQAARGQARIPSVKVIYRLIEEAKAQGWGDYEDDGQGGFRDLRSQANADQPAKG